MKESLADLFPHLGLPVKAGMVYEALLRRGPSSVRALAAAMGMNRGSVYEALKSLVAEGMASYYEKEKRQYFIAEEPHHLRELVDGCRKKLARTEHTLEQLLPALESWSQSPARKPMTRYYEGTKGVRIILEDVLATVGALPESGRLYRVYSALDIRSYLYTGFPHFTEERIKRKIMVHVLAVGPGGEEPEYAQRKVLARHSRLPTYTIMYANRCAFISLQAHKELHGVVIEDREIAETQRLLFDQLWNG